jgi:hypothetical protein
MRVGFSVIAFAAALATSATVVANPPAGPLPVSTQEVLQRYPGVQAYTDAGRVISLYGHPMNSAATPDQAAAAWLANDSGAFGVPGLTLRPAGVDPVMDGKFTVYAYDQFVLGLPVELGSARVLVLNGTRTSSVVYAAGKLAMPPEAAFAPLNISQSQALWSVRSQPRYKNLDNWGTPQLVAFYGEGDLAAWTAAVRTWKFMGWTTNMANHSAFTFFVDASTGAVLKIRDEVYHDDVSGTITGRATPGLGPDNAGNPPVATPISSIRVSITGGANAVTNATGAYTITNAGDTPVTVTTALNQGLWTAVVPNLSLSQSATPPGPADFLFNPTPSENTTGQVNGFVCTTKTHDYFRSRAPSFAALDMALTTNVNLSQTCNAFFSASGGLSINFFHSGGGCPNSAYSTVVSHEYGHFIVNRRNLAQGAFGEGYGDTNAAMIWDTPIIAQDFFGPGMPIRNLVTDHVQYPCSGEIHFCGEVLAGAWWDIRTNFGNAFGSAPGLEMVRSLEVAWSLVTVGGSGSNSATPQTAIEVLTLDDDDGNLGNGTPNYPLICAGFFNHGIQCPVVTNISFLYPDGRPTALVARQDTTIRVNVVPNGSNPAPGTGQLFYRVGSGAYTSVAMTETMPNQYIATIPAQHCSIAVSYYFRSGIQGGGSASDPPAAPTGAYMASTPVCSPACRSDLDGDGQLSVADFLLLLNLYAAGDMRADINHDGQVNVADYFAFLGDFSIGC